MLIAPLKCAVALTCICLHAFAIHLLFIVQVAEAIQCRGMQNRLADSIQVMASLSHPVCMTVPGVNSLCLTNSLCRQSVRRA